MLSTLVLSPTGRYRFVSRMQRDQNGQKETKSGGLWFDVRPSVERPTCLPGRLRLGLHDDGELTKMGIDFHE